LKTSVLTRAAVVAMAALALTACSTINPITTSKEYQASDGVSVDLGDSAKGINMLVMTTAVEAPAVLTGSIHNSGNDELLVQITIDGVVATDVTVAPDATVQLGTGAEQTLVQGTSPSAPGGLAPVVFSTAEVGAVAVEVPVVDGTLNPYQDVVDTIPPLPVTSPTPTE